MSSQPPPIPSKMANVTDIDELVAQILQWYWPNSQKSLLEAMLCSRRFFDIGAGILYRDYNWGRFLREHDFLVKDFSETEPRMMSVVRKIRTLELPQIDPAFLTRVLSTTHLIKLSLSMVSTVTPGAIQFESNSRAIRPLDSIWTALANAPVSLTHLNLTIHGSPLLPKQFHLPSTLVTLKLFIESHGLYFLATSEQGTQAFEALTRPSFEALFDCMSTLPRLATWEVGGSWLIPSVVKLLKGRPILVSKLKRLSVAPEALVDLINSFPEDFSPEHSKLEIKDERSLGSFNGIELPTSIKTMAIDIGEMFADSDDFDLDLLAPLLNALIRLPHLEELDASFSPTQIYLALTQWPTLLSKMPLLIIEPSMLSALQVVGPQFRPKHVNFAFETCSIGGFVATLLEPTGDAMVPGEPEWDQFTSWLESLDSTTESIEVTGCRTSWISSLKLPRTLSKLCLSYPIFDLSELGLEKEFEKIRPVLESGSRDHHLIVEFRSLPGGLMKLTASEKAMWKKLNFVRFYESKNGHSAGAVSFDRFANYAYVLK